MDNKSYYSGDNSNQGYQQNQSYQAGTGYQQGQSYQAGTGYQQGQSYQAGTGYQQAQGYNTNQGYNSTASYQVTQSQQPTTGTRCPGKEIAGLILGISALAMGVLAVIYCWIPVVSSAGIVFGIIALGCGIAALILASKVYQQATITTKKIRVGKGLGLAGVICGGIGFLFGIIMTAVYAATLSSLYYYY